MFTQLNCINTYRMYVAQQNCQHDMNIRLTDVRFKGTNAKLWLWRWHVFIRVFKGDRYEHNAKIGSSLVPIK